MRIRQMTVEDIPAVAQIEKECFSQPWSEQGFLDGMKDAIFFVAEDPQIAGYIGMYRMPPEGEITNVAVTRKMRKKAVEESFFLGCSNGPKNMELTGSYLKYVPEMSRRYTYTGHVDLKKLECEKIFISFPERMQILWSGNDYVRCMFVRNCRNDAAAVPVADITYAQI